MGGISPLARTPTPARPPPIVGRLRAWSARAAPSYVREDLTCHSCRRVRASGLPRVHSVYLESDFSKVLARTGTALRSEDPSATSAPGRHVLRVKIVRYDAGSKAARILVGAGAGAASIETHFELIGEQGTPLVTGDPEASSGFGGDWNDAVRTTNQQTVKAINDGLRRGS